MYVEIDGFLVTNFLLNIIIGDPKFGIKLRKNFSKLSLLFRRYIIKIERGRVALHSNTATRAL